MQHFSELGETYFWDNISLSYPQLLSPTSLPNYGGIYFKALKLVLFKFFDGACDLIDFRLQEKTECPFFLPSGD